MYGNNLVVCKNFDTKLQNIPQGTRVNLDIYIYALLHYCYCIKCFPRYLLNIIAFQSMTLSCGSHKLIRYISDILGVAIHTLIF